MRWRYLCALVALTVTPARNSRVPSEPATLGSANLVSLRGRSCTYRGGVHPLFAGVRPLPASNGGQARPAAAQLASRRTAPAARDRPADRGRKRDGLTLERCPRATAPAARRPNAMRRVRRHLERKSGLRGRRWSAGSGPARRLALPPRRLISARRRGPFPVSRGRADTPAFLG